MGNLVVFCLWGVVLLKDSVSMSMETESLEKDLVFIMVFRIEE